MIPRFTYVKNPNAPALQPERCKHVPSRRPDIVTAYGGKKLMLYRCIECCHEVSVILDDDDNPVAEFVGILVVT